MILTDQTSYQGQYKNKPQRIISLVPSQTELLQYLGLDKKVVGITKFCIHPAEWFDHKERIGGTKKLNIEKIKELQPDLILGNKEENTKKDIEQLRKEFPVWLSDVNDLDSAIDMIDQVGVLTGRIPKAQQLIHAICEAQQVLNNTTHRALYLIWNDPIMGVGKGTFIDCMLGKAGFNNALHSERYPELSSNDVTELRPDLIFLSSEPFPFKEKHRAKYQQKFPDSKVVLVDGELFSWYGSRLLLSFDYFRKLNEELLSL